MKKKENAQNSNIEEKILEELQKNCRLGLDEIGKKCGCSRYKVTRVIKKLEENNTIKGYTVVLNPRKLNYKHFIILMKRSSLPLDPELIKKNPLPRLNEFVPDTNIKSVASLYVNGNFDWVLAFTARDIAEAKNFQNMMLKLYNKYIEQLELLEVVGPLRMNGFELLTEEELQQLMNIF
jgi:DNA-binding Lrp family transcriptional regulator